ncbi:MAG: redoxin domain-containing protein [Verrucomicrobiales bacterium]|nr:redoxin domain-containing protein [Verrucomicrobiales bacterium]
MKHFATLLLVFLTPLTLSAENESTEIAPGHSSHGEVFNEGPRQSAVLIPGTGEVTLKVSTESGEAQTFFNQGLGQLHGFWDFEAERTFRQVAAIDPDCAMAYWGMAMANFKNDSRGKEFIEEAVARKEHCNEFEKLWIDGLAAYYKDTKLDLKKRLREFVRSLEKIATAYPDEIEAQAFLLKQIYYNNGKGLTIPSHYAVNLLAEKILSKAPNHPANHYQIHLWDKEDAAKALTAAANCGPAAPGIAHMWHMPGHIYSKLKRYDDAAWQQEASARVDHAHMIRYQIIPDRIHNFAHNNEWLIRNLNSLGKYDRSVELAANMISLPRLAKFKKKEDESTYDPNGSSWNYGRQRLRDTFIRFEQWDDYIFEAEKGTLKPDGKSISDNDHDRFLGIAKFETGDLAGGAKHLEAINERLALKKKERDEAVAKAETKAKEDRKDEKGITGAKTAAEKPFKSKIETLEDIQRELTVYSALTAEKPDAALAKENLEKLKNVAKHRHATLWQRAGDNEKAIKLAGEAVSSAKNEVLPLVAQVKILHNAGEKEKATAAFETLRTVAHGADSEIPLITSLNPIATDLGIALPWQKQPAAADDLGERPPLDTLGPFRWSPPKATPFRLTNADHVNSSLESLTARPVLLIFYLGRGCTHCMEQLNAFAPVYQKYKDAGIDIVAISTDSVAGLEKTFQNADEGKNPFPFPLYSDESLHTFKDYRAYDDFEKTPLHGTFLIDTSQHIRWQNISFEPFIYPNWMLEESIRLLGLDKTKS